MSQCQAGHALVSSVAAVNSRIQCDGCDAHMRGASVHSCRACDYDLCDGCAGKDDKDGHALVAMIEDNDLPRIISFHRTLRGGLGSLKQVAPASNPFNNVGPPMFWACWFRHFDCLKLLSVLGCQSDAKGTSGAWFKDKTLQQYAALLDSKAGHPYFKHTEETKRALSEAAAANLMSIRPDAPLEATLTDQKEIQAHLYNMVQHNSIVALRASLVSRPDLVNQLVAVDEYDNSGTLGHWCVWHSHWKMLDVWLELGGDLSRQGTGSGWLRNKDMEAYAAFLDRRGHGFYKFVHHVAQAKARRQEQLSAQEAAPHLDDEKQAGGQACVVCYDSPVSHTFLPCGHLCVCQGCGDTIMSGNSRCPICNTTATGIIAIFMAGVE